MTFAERSRQPAHQKGLTAEFAKRRARLAAGEKSLGWKVGLGGPAVLQRLGLAAPLVGFSDAARPRALRRRGVVPGLDQPVAEPEVCVRMATDLASGATPEATAAANIERP